MVGIQKEVNAIYNCPRIMNHKKLVSKNLMDHWQKKTNNIESQTNYNGFSFNAFLLLKNQYYNVGLNFVINFGINFIDFHFMVLLMCAHTKQAQVQELTQKKMQNIHETKAHTKRTK